MSDSRKLSGSNAKQAADIMQELEADEAYVHAMGAHEIIAEHLFNKREWRW